MSYPEVIDLSKYTGVSDAEVVKDIADTEAEIVALEKTRDAEDAQLASPLHSADSPQRRIVEFKRDARPEQIRARQAFIAFLKRIQAARTQFNQGNEP